MNDTGWERVSSWLAVGVMRLDSLLRHGIARGSRRRVMRARLGRLIQMA